MNRYLVLSNKKWHFDLINKLKDEISNSEWEYIEDKKMLNFEHIKSINPSKIFIPHWSNILPKDIYQNYECIIFHMTDLPFGRGGTPLQNLISRGYQKTKISALKATKGIDEGPIYLKKNLNLNGSAKEIYLRSSSIIYTMIKEIIEKSLTPKPQTGEIITFKRRSPEQSDISNLKNLKSVYDQIRMLDCDGYPYAFLETENFILEFKEAEYINQELKAKVTFKIKN